MKNFIFKSSDFGLIKNVSNKLDLLLAEQRNQRHDLKQLQISINKLSHDKDLQTTVDKYFEDVQPEDMTKLQSSDLD